MVSVMWRRLCPFLKSAENYDRRQNGGTCDQLKQAQMHTPAQRRVHTHSVSHTNVHKSEKKKKNVASQIKTGKVRYAHGIYPSSFNKTKGEITLDQMEKFAEVCCSTVASLL